jgi:alkyldihydroxyacetonephosphate synthase
VSEPLRPTPVIAIGAAPPAVGDRLVTSSVAVPDEVAAAIEASGTALSSDPGDRAEAARDWWPVAIAWAVRGEVPSRPAAVASPTSVAQVSAVLAAANAASVPVTAVAGRSGVCGASVPVFGGLALDTTGLRDPIVVDETSLVADIPAGWFGPEIEAELAARGTGYTLGHWPQSMDLSTIGGWVACRGAGQYSTRYGKIEDMVIGLEVVLADGRVITTEGRGPRSATGPSLTQLFVGSEGTLGIITSARVRIHARPAGEGRRAFGFSDVASGLEACRRILRRGGTPAVLRLYDATESARNFELDGTCALVVLDEADPGLVEATLAIVDEECAGAATLDDALVERWLSHRNDVSALAPLWQGGIAVDTAEVAARWAVLPDLASEVVRALEELEGTLVASVHESHAYLDGACLYFTFAGRAPEDQRGGPDEVAWQEDYYRRAWNTLTEMVEHHGGAISHHHGIGLNRSRFMAESLGGAFDVLVALKNSLDPQGILNPGKLGLPSPFGSVPWP